MPKTAKTQEQVAAHFRVTRRVLFQWRDKGAPIPKRGPYDLDAIQRWKEQSVSEKPRRQRGGDPKTEKPALAAQLLQEQVRLTRTKRRREQVALEKDRGRLILKSEYDRKLARIATKTQMLLLAIPVKEASTFVGIMTPAEAEEKLNEVMREVLMELGKQSIDEAPHGKR